MKDNGMLLFVVAFSSTFYLRYFKALIVKLKSILNWDKYLSICRPLNTPSGMTLFFLFLRKTNFQSPVYMGHRRELYYYFNLVSTECTFELRISESTVRSLSH